MTTSTSPASGFVDMDGARLYYELAGHGHPLLLLHAGIADNRMWDDQVPALAEHFRVARYDQRGYGQSSIALGSYAHASDLATVLDQLGFERCHLLGCSRGGSVALDFALQNPQRVSALVIAGSAPSGYEFKGDPPALWVEMEAAAKQGDLERTTELVVRLWVDGVQRTPGQVAAAIRDKVRAMVHIALSNEAAGQVGEQRTGPPAAQRLSEVRAPVLVVAGNLDDPNIVAASRMMAEQIPNARLALMEGTAHVPNMERPEEFNRLVLEFLGEQ